MQGSVNTSSGGGSFIQKKLKLGIFLPWFETSRCASGNFVPPVLLVSHLLLFSPPPGREGLLRGAEGHGLHRVRHRDRSHLRPAGLVSAHAAPSFPFGLFFFTKTVKPCPETPRPRCSPGRGLLRGFSAHSGGSQLPPAAGRGLLRSASPHFFWHPVCQRASL